MANGTQLGAPVGTGVVCATDDVSDVHYQVIKLADGTEDSATRIAAGGGVEANALRVTIASDSTGVLSVDDNGGSLTVDGTVAATQSGSWTIDLGATDNAVLDAIAASLAGTLTIAGAVTNAGTFAVQAAQSGTWTVQPGNTANTTAWLVTGTGGTFPATQSGTWTVDLGATDNAVLDAIAASLAGTLTVGSHAVTNAGTFAVQAAQSGTWTVDLGATDNAVLDAIAASVAGTLTISGSVTANAGTNLNTSALALETGGNLAAAATSLGILDNIVSGNEAQVDIVAALPAGTNNIGDVDVASIAAGSNLIGDVSLQPRTTGGLTMSKTTSAASTNATSLKASAGQVYSIQCFNVNAAVRYLKLYNKASSPTVGTDTPVKTLAIPGNTAGAGFVISWPQGLAFSTGIAFALTTEATDAGTTGVAANEITVNIDYK